MDGIEVQKEVAQSARIDLRGPIIAGDILIEIESGKPGFEAFMDARQAALKELIGQDITQNSIREDGERTNDRFIDSSFVSDGSITETVFQKDTKVEVEDLHK